MPAPRLFRVIVPVRDLAVAVPFYAALFEDAGFRVGYSLEDGVRAYADWMRANPNLLV